MVFAQVMNKPKQVLLAFNHHKDSLQDNSRRPVTMDSTFSKPNRSSAGGNSSLTRASLCSNGEEEIILLVNTGKGGGDLGRPEV